MTVKLLAEQHSEFLSLKGGCTGLPESINVKTQHCWKSRVATHFCTFEGCLVLFLLTIIIKCYKFPCSIKSWHFSAVKIIFIKKMLIVILHYLF